MYFQGAKVGQCIEIFLRLLEVKRLHLNYIQTHKLSIYSS